MLQSTSKIIASGLGSGYSPAMPGTCGSLVAMPIMYWLYSSIATTAGLQLGVAIIVTLLGILASLTCMQQQSFEVDDPQWIVIDEWAGIFITFVGSASLNLLTLAVGFLLFRFFDMLKPGPVRWAEQLPHALGVMADDVVAGVCAWAVLSVFIYVM